MLATVKKFITGVFATTYEKPELQKELITTRSILSELVIPSLNRIEDLTDEKSLQDKDNLQKMFKNMGFHTGNDVKVSISLLNSFAKELEDNIPKLEKILDSNIGDFITDKSMTARDAGIIGTISNISSIASYLSDITLLLSYSINNNDTSKNYIFKRVLSNISKFKPLYKSYNAKVFKKIKDIDGLSLVKVYDETNFKLSAGFKDKKFDLPMNNFVLNPIYHIRKLVVDLQIQYYDYLKYKRELIQLKIKEKELQDPSPSLEKQIKYYEEKLASIEYKIKKMEDSAND